MLEIDEKVYLRHVIFYLQMKECLHMKDYIKWNVIHSKKSLNLRIIRSIYESSEKYQGKIEEIQNALETHRFYQELQ